MYFKQFLHDDCGCASYFLASRAVTGGGVVDPQWIEPYLRRLPTSASTAHRTSSTRTCTPTTSRAPRPGQRHGRAGLRCTKPPTSPFPSVRSTTARTLALGQLVIARRPHARPPARSRSRLLVTNPPRSPEPSIVLSGDTLFVGDVGRPDFGGPEGAAHSSTTHSSGCCGLPDYVEVFPAHFEGSCGKGMCGRPSTTIGFERRFNPCCSCPRRRTSSRELIASRPARPLNMDAIMATNRGAAPMSWAMLRHPLSNVPEATAEQARPKIGGEWWLLDVREDEEWQRTHIPGAHHIPQSELATRLSEVPRNACRSSCATAGCARAGRGSS